ncbi:MAG: hypothetical protein ACRDGM_02545 [bacterium]
MPETVSIDRVEKMLAIATFHLLRFNDEHGKLAGRNTFAMEAYLVACLQVGGSVFYTLTNPPSKRLANPFARKADTWKAHLKTERKGDYDFFVRMLNHRGLAVHESTVATEAAVSAIPACMIPNLQGSGPTGMVGSRLVPGGVPASEQTYVMIDKLRLDGDDAGGAVKRFLDLLTELVQYCKASGS